MNDSGPAALGPLEERSAQPGADLLEYYDRSADLRYRNEFAVASRAGRPSYLDYLVREGVIAESERAATAAHLEELHSRSGVTGAFIEALRHATQQLLTDAGIPRLDDEPQIGLVHTPHFNACAVRASSGRLVIVLHSGVVAALPMFLHAVFGAFDRHADAPFCTHFTQAEFFDAIWAVAEVCVTGESVPRLDAAVTCPEHRGVDGPITEMAEFAEIFTLLHEYGHIYLGHLSNSVSEPTDRAQLMALARNQEHEADLFAVRAALAAAAAQETDPFGVIFGAGVMFTLFALIEEVAGHGTPDLRTHPWPATRWQAVLTEADNAGMTLGLLATWGLFVDRLIAYRDESIGGGVPSG